MKKSEPCLLPWVELHINTLGQLKTCCAQIGHLEKNNGAQLIESFNGANFKSIRAQFLAGETPKFCEACVMADANGLSYKSVKSKQWNSYAAEVLDPKNQDKRFPIRFLDLRFGNLCNFACRTCDSDNSSRWERIDALVNRGTNPAQPVNKETRLEQIFSTLDEVEEIYFAGGEPLLSEEHYLVLEEIIRRKKTKIKITYNTNLSLLSSHGRDVLNLWSKLEQVIVYPSIDSIGPQGEYIRPGFKWAQFESNFFKIEKYVGCLHSVLSAYNIFSISELILWSHQRNTMLSIFPAYHPLEISASVLPESVRKEACEKMRTLMENNNLSEWQRNQITPTLEFLSNNHTPEHLKKFVDFNKILDLHHKTNFTDIFPEHRQWLNS